MIPVVVIGLVLWWLFSDAKPVFGDVSIGEDYRVNGGNAADFDNRDYSVETGHQKMERLIEESTRAIEDFDRTNNLPEDVP